jgi:L-ascorbate metabolism protein UlaG (beta-lactamase superfamily)
MYVKTLKFYGHACFGLGDETTALLFDPFLTDNPFNVAKPDEVAANYILVSHGHFDHIGDTVAIAKRCGATVISTAEVCNKVSGDGCQAAPMHIGGKIPFPFGSVRVTLAFHGSGIPGGHACGFVVDFKGTVVYFAGDTGLFGDMELLGRLEKIDYALLPIGNNFTMGVEDAALAAGMLKAKKVIPMHYDTWPPIKQDPGKFKALVERNAGGEVLIMKPGSTLEL